MPCVLLWVPSSPGPDGLAVQDLDGAVRFAMRKLDPAERRSARFLVQPDTWLDLQQISEFRRTVEEDYSGRDNRQLTAAE